MSEAASDVMVDFDIFHIANLSQSFIFFTSGSVSSAWLMPNRRRSTAVRLLHIILVLGFGSFI
jgi:arginine exporter protein ArgO